MQTIKYIGFYDLPKKGHERVATLSGTNKMDYISSALNKVGFKVDIISPSWAVDYIKDKNNLRSKEIIIDDNKSLTLFPTFKTKSSIFKLFNILYSLVYLLFWLLKNVKRNEKVLVYHAPLLSYPLLIAKYIKGFDLILEVEEIYSEVWKSKRLYSKMEWRIIKASTQYICASDLLAKRLDFNKSIVIYGSYEVSSNKNDVKKREGINLVYAGSLDTVKGGVFNSIESMKILDNNYKLHICGYGTENQIEIISEKIKDLNRILKRDACIFHGKLLGEELSDLLFSCNIALNPQHQGDYMGTAFPSKILTYLTHNLHILSTNIESIKASVLAPCINFSKNDSAIEIAKTIRKINIEKDNDNEQIVADLETKLIKDMKLFFQL